MSDIRSPNDPRLNTGPLPSLFPNKQPAAFTPSVPAQPWYTSKTTWMGVLTVIVSLLPFVGNVIPVDERDAFASAMATIAPIVGSVIGALVIYFRRVADTPIKNGPADPAVKAGD